MEAKVIVKSEEYSKKHTDKIDKEVYKRVMDNDDTGVKITIEQSEPFPDEFNEGEELKVTFFNPQQRLTE